MNFISFDNGGRYKRRAAEMRWKFFASVLIISIVAGMSIWWGGENVRSSEVAYKQQALQLQAERAGLEETITGLRSDIQSTQVRYQQLEQKYQAEVPQGEFKRLTDLVKKQLDAGIKPERMAFVIEAARPPR